MMIVFGNRLKDKYIRQIEAAGENIKVLPVSNLEGVEDSVIKKMEVLVVWGFDRNLNSDLLDKASNLKWVHVLSAGIEGMPVKEILNKGIKMTKSVGVYADTVSEHAFGMILALARGFNLLMRNQLEAKWERVKALRLKGKTLGIIGLGDIGKAIARRGKAFGMKVIGIKRKNEPLENVDEVLSLKDLDVLLKTSDFVVVALPLTDETYHMIGEHEFEMMKETAYIINISRGEVIDEAAMLKALKQRWIKGAGLDVFSKEPIPESSPLWKMENVIVSPHMAALSPDYMRESVELFCSNLKNYLEGKEMKGLVTMDRPY